MQESIFQCVLAPYFCLDPSVYLELRSTPRAFDASSSKRDYMSTVMEGVAAFGGGMRTRLLVSVDRSKSVEEARENLPIQLHRTVLRIMPAGVPFQVDKGLPIQAARKLPMQVDKDPAIQHQVMSSHGRMELPVQFKTRV